METPDLPRGNWQSDVYRNLCDLIEDGGQRRVAVFDFDNTCVVGDIGELFSHFLVERMRYRYDLEAFWELIHPDDGRARLRQVTEAALEVEPAMRPESAAYQEYLAQMAALYGRRLERAGRRDCYQWAVRLHVGLTCEQLREWSKEAVERCISTPMHRQRFETHDGRRVEIRRGIRPLVEMRQLMRTLQQANFDIWIVSATNIWTVTMAAKLFDIPAERVLGNRVAVEGSTLTSTICRPVLFREGKLEVIDRVIGRRPAFVAGDAITDYEMLCAAEELALVIDRGDELLRREGRRRDWAVQPQAQLTPQKGPQRPKN